jgi:hypothetical protein
MSEPITTSETMTGHVTYNAYYVTSKAIFNVREYAITNTFCPVAGRGFAGGVGQRTIFLLKESPRIPGQHDRQYPQGFDRWNCWWNCSGE